MLVEVPGVLGEEHGQIGSANLGGPVVVVVQNDGSNAQRLGIRHVGEVVESSDNFQAANDGQVIRHTVGSSQSPLLANDGSTAEMLAGIRTHHPLQAHHERRRATDGRGSSNNAVSDFICGWRWGTEKMHISCSKFNNFTQLGSHRNRRKTLHLGTATTAQIRAANTINPLIVFGGGVPLENYWAVRQVLGLFIPESVPVIHITHIRSSDLIILYKLITTNQYPIRSSAII